MKKESTLILVSSQHRKWIIDFLAQDISKKLDYKIEYLPTRRLHRRRLFWKKLPTIDRILLMHQSLYPFIVANEFRIGNANLEVFYTHEGDEVFDTDKKYPIRKIYCMSSGQSAKIKIKFPNIPVVTTIGGPNEDYFPWMDIPRNREVLLVSDYKPRKNPELIKEAVEGISDWNFTLHGRGWDRFIFESGLNKCSNFEYSKFDFQHGSDFYHKSPVFLSLSILEGGPLPAIEALMSGCAVVATDTGFARDLAERFPNVFVIPVKSSVREIREGIEMARFAPKATLEQLESISQDHFIEKFHA